MKKKPDKKPNIFLYTKKTTTKKKHTKKTSQFGWWLFKYLAQDLQNNLKDYLEEM